MNTKKVEARNVNVGDKLVTANGAYRVVSVRAAGSGAAGSIIMAVEDRSERFGIAQLTYTPTTMVEVEPGPPAFFIPEEAWKQDLDDERLRATIVINGTEFWCEALAVKEGGPLGDEQMGVGENSESRLSALCDEYSSPGFQTVNIKGKPYVIIITPWGR